jgi:DNA-binding Lrp family transcriptional regulator
MKREDLPSPGTPPRRLDLRGEQLEFRLLNEYQRGFPLVVQPFRAIAEALDCDEASVLALLRKLTAEGSVSRVGAVFAPRRVGASTLAALAAPGGELERIAAQVNARAEVNHNYEREHRLNLWFVATAADSLRLDEVLRGIERDTDCEVLSLPLLEEFHIDLGFDLAAAPERKTARGVKVAEAYRPTQQEQRLLAALQGGLDLVPRPFARLAMRAGMHEDEVLAFVMRWLAAEVVKRFGVVVRHRELGFNANAMVVWDVPEQAVSALGVRLAGEPQVTLCYRRRRHLPQWGYNLFCMIHGRNRLEVEQTINALRDRHDLHAFPNAVLFSRRRFKQQGARYFDAPCTAAGHA